jgi:hypothetical protein
MMTVGGIFMRAQLLGCALGLAVMSAAALNAQTEVKRTTKVEVKGGKEITTTGCVGRTGDGRYTLTSVGGEMQYILVGHENMSKHTGHRIQVRGKATDLGDAEVKTETKTSTKTDVDHGPDQASQRKTTTEQKGDLAGVRFLSVDSVKTLADSCQ